MRALLKDLQYGIRMLIKNPAFTVVAVLSLALGIGANTTVFTLLDAVMLRSLPVRNPDQIVQIATREAPGEPHYDFSYPLYAGLRDHNDVFSGMLAYTDTSLGLTAGDQTEQIRGEFVSANYFSVLGIQTTLGSAFAPDDERAGAPRVAVISYNLWQRRLNGEPSALQKTIVVNGRTFAVAGVAPKNFFGMLRGQQTDVWMTLPHNADFEGNPRLLTSDQVSWLNLAGRLKPGTTIEQAQARLTTLLPGLSEDARQSGKWTAALFRASGGNAAYVAELGRPLKLLLIAVGLILTIACANVAGLLFARARARAREIGIRLSLGATRWRIIRQLLVESVLLAFAGGALGYLMAVWTSGLASGLRTRAGGDLNLDVAPNARVFLFTLLVSVLTVLLFGLVPALRTSRVHLVPVLKGESNGFFFPRGPSLHSLLVISQISLSLVLLAGAGVFLRSFWKLQSIERGFIGDNVLAMSLNMNLQGFDDQRGQNLYAAALERLSAFPGIQSASLASALPVSMAGSRMERPANGTQPAVPEYVSIDIISISPRFFETTGLPLIKGRDFRLIDSEKSEQVIIVNESMARKFWPGEDPVGRAFNDGSNTFEVVGVAGDTKYRNLREEPRLAMYQPLSQSYRPSMNLLVRTANDPTKLAPAIKSQLHSIEPGLTIFNVRTLLEHVGRSLYVERLESLLLILFGLLALMLTMIGIYGVIAYSVAQRTREVGIRIALGAQRQDVLKLILIKGLTLVAWGSGLGLIGCYWLSRLVSSQLYGVSANDPATLASAALILIAVALIASYLPARRATKVDPLVALRYE
jgi:predicted permease